MLIRLAIAAGVVVVVVAGVLAWLSWRVRLDGREGAQAGAFRPRR